MAFDYFVVLAEMRTGSNLLESYLNAVPDLTCHGELFNPGFIVGKGQQAYLGLSLADRDEDPWRMLNAIRAGGGRMNGFRLFHDHDPRIWEHALNDTACAKIVLTRNPLDSYVSRKIAAATNQWRLGNVLTRKKAKARFDGDEFLAHVERLQTTQKTIQRHLQTTGQAAYYIGYDDLNDLDVINGLLRWLGHPHRLANLPRDLKKQNPEPVRDKLENPDDLATALARVDRFDLTRTPNFEPPRGPLLAALRAARGTPLLFMPLRGAPEESVNQWLAALDGQGAPVDGFDEGRLQAWRRDRPGHRSFTVLRHPLKRMHWLYTRRLLTGQMEPVAEHMTRLFDARLDGDNSALSAEQHQANMAALLKFARASLNGQTGLQPWPAWASQSANLAGYASIGTPDLILREETLSRDLPALAASLATAPGAPTPPSYGPPYAPPHESSPMAEPPVSLFVTPELQALCRQAYERDYVQFGFADLPEA